MIKQEVSSFGSILAMTESAGDILPDGSLYFHEKGQSL
jgi:hypothetical protein